MDGHAKLGDSRSNSGRITRFFGRLNPFDNFVQYLIAFCSQLEAGSDVISSRFVRPIVPDKYVKFGDSRFNRS